MRGTAIKAKKLQKDRVTVMVGSSMDGHKFEPVVIGRAANPRCFAGINKEDLPVIYFNSANAWVTKDIMYEWFYQHFVPEIKKQYKDQKVIYLFLSLLT